MITSITFQWKYNRKYLIASQITFRGFGDKDTDDLQEELSDDMAHFERLRNIVSDINNNPINCNVLEIISNNTTGGTPRVTHKTKKSRTYYWGGLTIHEEDK